MPRTVDVTVEGKWTVWSRMKIDLAVTMAEFGLPGLACRVLRRLTLKMRVGRGRWRRERIRGVEWTG